MHDSSNKSLLGSGTSTAEKLCFDKSEFMKTNFSVDEFLHKNRNVPSLELLRDNLGLYLKDLRASMIDLINEDYADFVSLSANLVGLDQLIKKIKLPLEQFRDEIDSIHNLIKENVSAIRSHLAQKQKLRKEKRNLVCLQKVYELVEQLNTLLTLKLNSNQHIKIVDLERVALDLIQLKFNENYCIHYLDETKIEQISSLQTEIHDRLRYFFNEAIKTANSTSSEQLERCLRIYIILDACDIAETVFREDFVTPYMANVISEQQLQNSPQGLAGIYSKVLNFISLHMTDLLRLTQYSDKLCGFNFIVNSFWADVESQLEVNMNSIFAPGNSEVFYIKYKCTRDFMQKIEELLASSDEFAVQRFRQHKQTRKFLARWNLPVYFQICFQEIGGQFESMLVPLLSADTLNTKNSSSKFQLLPFNTADQAIQRCWSEGVYLPEVFPKFFKLTIQIVLRLGRWIADVLNLLRDNTQKLPLGRNKLLTALHVDICRFYSMIPEIKTLILKNVSLEYCNPLLKVTVTKSIQDLSETMNEQLKCIQKCLVELLYMECGKDSVRQVHDLPRLYRKTNRELPTRCSTYVEQMLRPLKSFHSEFQTQLGTLIVEEILSQVCNDISKDYYIVANEVLTSVQKTEESLRRLRNLKSGNTTASTTTGLSSMSDDDKIRLQLFVDVNVWTDELSKLNVTPSQIKNLQDLNKLVEEFVKLKEICSNYENITRQHN